MQRKAKSRGPWMKEKEKFKNVWIFLKSEKAAACAQGHGIDSMADASGGMQAMRAALGEAQVSKCLTFPTALSLSKIFWKTIARMYMAISMPKQIYYSRSAGTLDKATVKPWKKKMLSFQLRKSSGFDACFVWLWAFGQVCCPHQHKSQVLHVNDHRHRLRFQTQTDVLFCDFQALNALSLP